MRVCVTGSSGFLGRHLVRRLEAQGHHVTALTSRDCDLGRPQPADALPAEPYERIYHLAAWTRAGDFCRTHSGEQWLVNQYINTNVLAWWAERQRQAKLIAFGTSVSYASEDDLAEEAYLLGEPKADYYAYAMSKRMLLAGLRALHKQFGMRYLYLIPSTLYGPDYHADGRPMHFIYDLIRKIIRGKELGEEVVLWGDGYQKRELVLVDDFIATLAALVDKVDNDLVNIGAGEEYSIRTFAGHICRIVGYPEEKIRYDTSRYVGATSKCLSVAKLKRLLPGYAPTALETGLKSTIAWFYQSKAYLQR